jgi:hypothetical protein
MSWYRVTKKIRGRLYDYWQRSIRVGKQVKTENRYIGPTSAVIAAGSTTPDTPVEFATLSKSERREDERVQYGPLKARIARQKAAVRKAKRSSRRTGAANPFLGQAIT